MVEYLEKRASAKAARLAARAAERIERERLREIAREAKRIATLERSRQGARVWRLANPGKSAILQKAWREKNRDKVRANKRARKASKRATVIRDLMKLQRGRCAYCREKLTADAHVDHVMPLKLDGPDKRSNLQLACAPCNLSKSARHPIEFAQSLGRLL